MKNYYNNLFNIIFCILSFLVFTSNVTIFSIGSFKILPIQLFALFFAFFLLTIKTKPSTHVTTILYSFVPLFGVINASDIAQFLVSYLVYLILIVFYFYGSVIINRINIHVIDKSLKLFWFFLFLSSVFSIFQFILANYYDPQIAYNFFGSFQFHPHLDNQIFGIYRATSVFYEPSFLGIMAYVGITTIILLKDKIKINLFYFNLYLFSFLTSLFLSFSTTAYISLFIFLFILIFYKSKTLTFFILIILISSIFIFQDIINISRIDSIFIENTSGYARVTYPLLMTIEILEKLPLFGRGLGQIGIYDETLTFNGYIFNAWLGIVYTFGFSSLFFLIPFFRSFFKVNHFKELNKIKNIILISIFLVFSSTGEFVGLSIPLLMIYYLFTYRYYQITLSISND
jgi:hypothetical protein